MPPDAITVAEAPAPPVAPRRSVRFSIPANNASVRDILNYLNGFLELGGIRQDLRGNAEIVLAEILNNVVEHAYSDMAVGPIDLEVDLHQARLCVSVVDHGRPMPGYRMPPRGPVNLDVDRMNLPEGGFGWCLIHELVDDLSYARRDDSNMVRFSMRLS